MSFKSLALTAAVFGLFSAPAMAQQSDLLVRVRAVNISPADKSDPVGGAGNADRITVSSKTIPEFDVSYFFSPNIAAELVLTYPQKHDVYLDGGRIGSFKHLPPTLLAQYHFTPESSFSPYLGVGLNYTRISSVSLLNNTGSLENSSVGLALQAGMDFKLDKQWSINVDIKKVKIGSDVRINGAKVSTVNIDPVLFGVGVGYRF